MNVDVVRRASPGALIERESIENERKHWMHQFLPPLPNIKLSNLKGLHHVMVSNRGAKIFWDRQRQELATLCATPTKTTTPPQHPNLALAVGIIFRSSQDEARQVSSPPKMAL